MTRSLTALILAGGRSSRMGTDKALLQLSGRSLLDRAIGLAQGCGAGRVHVLGRPGHEAGVADSTAFAGPAMAVRDWLQANPDAGRLLVLPVDMPALRPHHLAPLLDHERGACFAGYFLPFTATVPQAPLPATERVRALLELLQVQQLAVPKGAENWLANINRPEDLENLKKYLAQAQSRDGSAGAASDADGASPSNSSPSGKR